MNEFTYQKFLEDKLKDQHTNAHLLEEDITSFKERNIKLLKDIAVLRKSEKDMKLRLKQMEEKITQQQIEIKKLKEIRVQKTKEVSQKRVREQKIGLSSMDSKQIFKMYLDNTFPKYKGLLKKILKLLYIIEGHDNQEPEQKVKFYRAIFEKGVKRLLDWLFPKQQVAENKREIAENIVNRWKQQQKEEKSNISKDNLLLLKQVSYVKQIESLEAQILQLNSSKKLLEGRLKTYERTTQVKGSEFVAHLKKMLKDQQQYEPEAYDKVQEIIKLFTEVIHLSGRKVQEEDSQQRMIPQIPLILTTNNLPSSYKKKPAPVLKKNVFGYYQDPQFAGNYNFAVPTKHVDCNKYTQTLSEDLCILTLHPVIMVTLIDASIKPQRTRHSLQHYVKIKINEENSVDSLAKQGLQLVWNQPFLLKDYDFPFINVQLMHKSKGLRDYSLGGGKFSASSQEQKIVNVRKQKEFIGRVRFSLSYPKGSIYEFKITSVLLEIPSGKNVLKQLVIIQFPYNSIFSLQFCLPEKIVYTDKSMIILDNCEEKMQVFLPKQKLVERVSLSEFTAKEGHKQVTVLLDNQWKVIIQGEVYLLICEDQQPQRISEELLEGGKGKFFSVRAPPPIVSVTYDKTTLHSSIKFPLVFRLAQSTNSLSIIKQQQNRELSEQKVEAITNSDGYLKLSQFIKAPGKIYKFFIETIEGQQVFLKHESHLFERLLKEIHLQISYKEDQAQQISYARKGKQQRQMLYKQFTIQTKELMLNHYKVFSRHFKRIGFVKFKLGYTVYDNLLLPESNQAKPLQISYSLPEGTYFLYIQLTCAHLNSKSTGSSYSCKIKDFKTKQVKGNQPVWSEGFTFSFQFKDKLQISIQYQVTEHCTFGSTIIYKGNIVIDQKTLELGSIMVALDQKGEDCLHFSNLRIPNSIFHIAIDSIQAEIEEEADWIGKIDPYLTVYSQNRELLKTQYLDNVGSHPIWQKINQQFYISSKDDAKQRDEDILCLKICDYDLIGRDDYIGEVLIGTKLNSELVSETGTQVLHGNIVKENQICGSLKLRGRFKRIAQKTISFKSQQHRKLTKKDVPYRLVVYALEFNQLQEYEGDQGWVNLLSENDPSSAGSRKCAFMFEQKVLNSFNLALWNIQSSTYTFEIERQYKSFFKTTVQTLGRFSIAAGQHFSLSKTEIVDEKKQVVGYCHYFVEFRNKVKYVILSSTSLCKPFTKIKSDLNDEISLDTKDVSNSPRFLFYCDKIHGEVTVGDKVQRVELMKNERQNIYNVVSTHPKHKDDVAVIKLQGQLLFECQLQERSEVQKLTKDRQFKKIKYLHWQPFKYRELHSYKLILKCTNNECFELTQSVASIYNDHLILKETAIPIIFDSKYPPESILIKNLSTNEEDKVSLKDDIIKIFIPNRGALYYHLQDYNSKSILQLNFQYLFIRVKNIQVLSNFKNISAHLTTSLSSKTFTSTVIYRQECFSFNNMTIYVPDPPTSGVFFFEGFFEGCSQTNDQRQTITRFKFGLKLENNKLAYRFVDGQEVVVHTYFSCCLVERKYQVPAPIDNTIYGMSFIQLRTLDFEINEDPTSRPIYLELSLNNQIQKIYLQRKGQSCIYRAQSTSIYFIQTLVEAHFSLFEEGILSNSFIGSGSLTLVDHNVQKDTVELTTEVKKDNENIGRMSICYRNLREISFIDINLFSYISKSTQLRMKAELQQIGPNKNKFQTISLTSRGNIPRLQSEDSFIVTSDPRNYHINVSEQESKKLLGEFKLCHELPGIGDKVTVLQPLRTSADFLNGVLIIQYEKKQATSLALQKNKDTQINLIEISITDLTFKDHSQKLKDQFAINLKTPARNLTTKPISILKPAFQKPITFNLYSTQFCEFTLLEKQELIGSAFIKGPFFNQQQIISVFYRSQQAVAICRLRIRFITNKEELMCKREVVSLQATDLMDTQYFVKMKPYVDIEPLNNQHWPCFRSDLGLGKENIYWKLGLITQQPLDLIFKDKDIFFDDLIGNAVLPKAQTMQKEEKVFEMTLTSTEGDNRGNGKIKVITHPVICNELCQQKNNKQDEMMIKRYLLRLGGFSTKNNLRLSQGQSLQISIGNNLSSCLLFQAQYHKDIEYYLHNKDIEVQFDTAFLENLQFCSILITIKANQQTMAQQLLSINGSQKPISTEIFTMTQVVPLQIRCFSLSKVYFWMNFDLERDVEVYTIAKYKIQRLRILLIQQRLIIVEPFQLVDVDKRGVSLLLVENQREICRVELQISGKDMNNQIAINKLAFNEKSMQIGYCYAEVYRVSSQGSEEGSKNWIGKSQKKWLLVTVVEASLTKDLQFFSKMDPYCKFTIDDGHNRQNQWLQTAVQDNIGLKPIWNESYFLPLPQKLQTGSYLRFLVMDSEVTVDRKIGQGKVLVDSLGHNKTKQIELFYSESEKSGTLTICSKTTAKYIIIRSITKAKLESNSQPLLLIHQDNSFNRKGQKIQQGVAYPLDEQLPIIFQFGSSQKSFKFMELKEQNQKRILFEKQFVSILYELYD